MMRKRSGISLLLFVALSVACQSTTEPQPAVLEASDPETVARLKSVLAAALEKGRVELGEGDLTVLPEIAVLPPRPGPHETMSPALPTYFDLAVSDGSCVVIRRATGEVFDVPGAVCLPLTK